MEYFTLLTQIGAQKIAAATAANTTVALAEIALGDGNGTVPMPDASKTALVNEVYRAPLNDLRVDENNANWLVAEGYVPSDEGNFWVREVGVFDSDGDLIIIGNYPETFKPITSNGVAKDLYMKVITEVSSADAVALSVDPSVVMASQEFVNERLKDKSDKNHNHDTEYAAINGDGAKKFKVAQATDDNDAINKKQLDAAILSAGKILQVVSASDNTPRVSSSIIPKDNTIPQSNEGMEILSCSIVPKSNNSKFLIFTTAYGSETSNHSDALVMSLFKDNESSAFDTFFTSIDATGYYMIHQLTGVSILDNLDLLEKNIKVRIGCDNGAVSSLNGDNLTYYNTGDYGSKIANSIIIMEVRNDS